jgi:hypothetical protein
MYSTEDAKRARADWAMRGRQRPAEQGGLAQPGWTGWAESQREIKWELIFEFQ